MAALRSHAAIGGLPGQHTPPPLLSDLVGQPRLRGALKALIHAARSQKRPLDHFLIVGPRGMGKAAFAAATAHELGHPSISIAADSLRDSIAMAELFVDLPLGRLLLLEHTECLAGGRLRLLADHITRPGARVLVRLSDAPGTAPIRLPAFTVMGTAERLPPTLKALEGPLLIFHMDPYAPVELQQLVMAAAARAGVKIDERAAERLVMNAQGSPERLLALLGRLLRRLRQPQEISLSTVRLALQSMGYW